MCTERKATCKYVLECFLSATMQANGNTYMTFTYLQGNAANLVLWVVKMMEVLCNACLIALFSYVICLNPYKHSVVLVGHRQTMQNQTGHRRMRRLIRVFTIGLQNFLFNFE